ncbi:MAG: BON domain-containing protein [Bacteroidales bacterium]|nr:BON domain-containing protein [Bacteroidales bacterium]MCF8399073.1 BON domain-containing protein [Bacteroidales bacterium]
MKKLKSTLRFFTITSVLLIALFPAQAMAQEKEIDDQKIRASVETELMLHEDVQSNNIDVSSNDGIVMLRGTSPNILAKDRAEKITSAVKGVKGVINEIIVLTPERPDKALKQDIESELFINPVTESYQIDVQVNEGKVKLGGEVESYQERKLAEHVVKGVKGVKKVENNIGFKVVENRPDYEIQNDIVYALENDVRVDDALIDVEVNDGKVQLSGTVGSLAEKSQAIVLSWTSGVRSVNSDNLNIQAWARDELIRKEKYLDKADEKIIEAIQSAFDLNPRVNEVEIEVESTDGMVTLQGIVDNLSAKNSAERTAKNIVGVHTVNNLIKVRPEIPDDITLEKEVTESLLRNPYLENFEFTVDVNNGIVYLSGMVNSYFEKFEAEEIAGSVYGVVDVANNIEVRDYNLVQTRKYEYDFHDWDHLFPAEYTKSVYRPGITDEDLEAAVESQIWWSPFVDLDDLNIQVDQGVVSLSGTVDTRVEREAAVKNAYEAGANMVVNEMEVVY